MDQYHFKGIRWSHLYILCDEILVVKKVGVRNINTINLKGRQGLEERKSVTETKCV